VSEFGVRDHGGGRSDALRSGRRLLKVSQERCAPRLLRVCEPTRHVKSVAEPQRWIRVRDLYIVFSLLYFPSFITCHVKSVASVPSTVAATSSMKLAGSVSAGAAAPGEQKDLGAGLFSIGSGVHTHNMTISSKRTT